MVDSPDEDSGLVDLARIAGSKGAEDADAFFVGLYAELRKRANKQMASQKSGHTLQPTALVHEIYLKLAEHDYSDREHFLATAAKAMRCVLVDHARRQQTEKRGDVKSRLALDQWIEQLESPAGQPTDLLEFDEVLRSLEQHSPETASLVEMRFFGGLTVEECARIQDVPLRTLERRWQAARAWLAVKLSPRD